MNKVTPFLMFNDQLEASVKDPRKVEARDRRHDENGEARRRGAGAAYAGALIRRSCPRPSDATAESLHQQPAVKPAIPNAMSRRALFNQRGLTNSPIFRRSEVNRTSGKTAKEKLQAAGSPG